MARISAGSQLHRDDVSVPLGSGSEWSGSKASSYPNQRDCQVRDVTLPKQTEWRDRVPVQAEVKG